MDVPVRFRPALSAIVDRLAARDYEGLKRDGIDPHPAADLTVWIRNYGRTGVTIGSKAEDVWSAADAEPIPSRPGQWHVVLPLDVRGRREPPVTDGDDHRVGR